MDTLDVALAILLALTLVIIPLGTSGVNLVKYARVVSARAEAYSRLQTISDVVSAFADNTFTKTATPPLIFDVEYTTTTATTSPRIKEYGDHIDYNSRTYNIAWWEIWVQNAIGQWQGIIIATPPNGQP